MRLLHTADWHVGKTLYGFDRTPEIREAMLETLEIGLAHNVDAILAAGDLFDNRNPSAEAEQAVYEFMREANMAGLPLIIIAGNHDSPRRLDALAEFMRNHNIHIIGKPRGVKDGGLITLNIRGEELKVAGFPFVSDRVLRSSEEMFSGELAEGITSYQEKVRRFLHGLASGFRSDTANVLLMHGTMHGARLSGSERVFHSGRDFVVDPAHLPDTVSYVAMGHIHMAQGLEGFPEEQARYSGSLVQLDFGEAGDEKRAYVVEVSPGVPARTIASVPIKSGRELRVERLTVAQLESRHEELRAFPGHLKVIVQVESSDPSIRERVRQRLPNARVIQVEVPRARVEERPIVSVSGSHRENFVWYWRETHGGEVDAAVMRKFDELLARVDDSEDPVGVESGVLV